MSFRVKTSSCVAIVAMGLLTVPAKAAPEAKKHSVNLSWELAPGHVVGYNIYRGTKKGGPYVKIVSNVAKPPYQDSAVDSHRTYYYVVTSVDERGMESAYSKEIKASLP